MWFKKKHSPCEIVIRIEYEPSQSCEEIVILCGRTDKHHHNHCHHHEYEDCDC